MDTSPFVEIVDTHDLAAYLGLRHEALSRILSLSPEYKYTAFEIPKKRGGSRRILAPCSRLKAVQRSLAAALDDVYRAPPSAHGFVSGKSIVTNASLHAGKRHVFNVDLLDFFGCIGFARVRGLFMAKPFGFSEDLATVVAQICCLEDALPQGAPTSPVVSNMIAWKLDGQLQALARRCRATYTRYADDITFSFTRSAADLPADIVVLTDDGVARAGAALTGLIEVNGFTINQAKVHLADQSGRMKVTGLTVNRMPNISRRYVRQIGSMLHAWRKHGYDAAQARFNLEYDDRYRPSGQPKFLADVVMGKLLYLKSVRGEANPVFVKLATQFNRQVGDKAAHLKIRDPVGALWVIESDDKDADTESPQGSGFWLEGVGLVTCGHCVVDPDDEPLPNVVAFKADDPSRKYPIDVLAASWKRDIAVCRLLPKSDRYPLNDAVVRLANKPVERNQPLTMLGFPDYWAGATHSSADVAVTGFFSRFGVKFFRVNTHIAKGNSGGPLVDAHGNVAGMAVLGAKDDGDQINGAMVHEIISHFIENELADALRERGLCRGSARED